MGRKLSTIPAIGRNIKKYNMIISVLKSKIHKARITDSNLNYQGSLGIDKDIMDKVGLYDYEKILIANLTNGNRLETYVIPQERNSKSFLLNGAAAHKGKIGDIIIVMSFAQIDLSKLSHFNPKIIVLDEGNNEIKSNC